QILAPAVDVERRAEVLHRHGRALDVPARSAGAPRARPRRLAGLRRLPHGEVARVTLPLVHLDTGPRQQFLEVLARETAVRREAAYLEIDVAGDDVGDASANEPLDERDHRRDVVGGLRLDVTGQDPDRLHVAMELGDVAFRDLACANAFGVGAL